MSFPSPVPASVLAFVTTVHLALVVLRAHRSSLGPFSLAVVVSLLLAASPWLLSSPVGLAVGLAVHLAWFAACERLLPRASVPGPALVSAAAVSPPPVPITAAPVARRPREFVQVPVLSVFDETHDIRTFRMARPDGFEFKAGQFLAVRVRADGKEHVRCYSISSPPAARGYLEISVKRIGLVSGTLHATLRPGSMVSVKAPAGAFVYPAGEDRPLVLIAGGVGITPLLSMLHHAVQHEPMRPITLFYSVRTEEDIAFHEELRLLDRRHPQFRPFIAITDGPAGSGHFPDRLNQEFLSAMVPDIGHALCLICGPKSMLASMKELLAAVGVPQPQIRFEVFDAAVAASAGPPRPDHVAEPGPAGAHQLRFERSGRTTKIEGARTMLEAAESCGAPIPSLCRAGVCGTCRTRVLSGEVDCASQMLDDEERRDGFVLACVTRVNSDCRVDA